MNYSKLEEAMKSVVLIVDRRMDIEKHTWRSFHFEI
jgi:hypothetical protein